MFPAGQLFFTTKEGCRALRELGRENALPLEIGQSATVGEFTVTAVFALHSTEAFGLIVKAEGITLWFSGDTLYSEKLFEIAKYHPDVTFICINGRLGNMTCDEALKTAKAIDAKVNIPNHYDMFASNSADPHLFADHVSGGKILDFNHCYDVAKWL